MLQVFGDSLVTTYTLIQCHTNQTGFKVLKLFLKFKNKDISPLKITQNFISH